MKRYIVLSCFLFLMGCAPKHPFTICTTGWSRQCFDVDRVRQDQNGCVVSENAMICGSFTVEQRFIVTDPEPPKSSAPAASASSSSVDPVIRAN